jgi:CRISPR-associated protein Csd1
LIINALYELYCRLRDDPNVEIDIPGMSKAKVSYELVISQDGELKGVNDLRRQEKNKFYPVEMMVPQQNKRAMGDYPYLLCDKAEYLLGLIEEGGDPNRTERRFEASKGLHEEALGNIPEATPVLEFLRKWNPKQAENHPLLTELLEELKTGGTIVFRVSGESEYMHKRPTIASAAGSYMAQAAKTENAFCLVTGTYGPASSVHNSVKGVKGAQPSGAALISFNCDAFTSYGKEQSINAPVSVDVARGYVAALNWLLSDRKHKVQLGDATTVFWAEAPEAESLMHKLFGQDYEEDRQDAESVKARDHLNDILTRLSQGRSVSEEMLGFDPGTKTYVLGLSPNNSRLAVRFWHVDSFGEMIRKAARHYADMALVRQFESQEEFIPLPRILREMAPLGDAGNLPSTMTGGLMRAILSGGPYPEGVYAAMIERIRANDGGKDARGNGLNPVNYVRVSVIKAVLTRKARIHKNKEEECLTMSLNQTTDTAYRLGRLFALLEKAQQDANPGINSTIRDRYFGTASASPMAVFPLLLRLNQHHIKKSDYGVGMDRRIQEVVGGIEAFPAHLNLEEQGKFMLGYYHQMQDLYTKKSDNAKGEENDGEGN